MICILKSWFRDHFAKEGGQRQAAPALEGIRADHTGRYVYAAKHIPEGADVLDMACGVGYGAFLLSGKTRCKSVLAVDISEKAVEYARRHYAAENIIYRREDCLKIALEDEKYDVSVSFETIEHIEDDRRLLETFCRVLKPGGKLILSTPNQELLPYSKSRFPFHVKHYTPSELKQLLEGTGFRILEVVSQPDKKSGEIVPGWDGIFNIAVCEKKA